MLPKILNPKSRLIIPYTIPDCGILRFEVESSERTNILAFDKRFDKTSIINAIVQDATYYSRHNQQHCLYLIDRAQEKYIIVIENNNNNYSSVVYQAFEGKN